MDTLNTNLLDAVINGDVEAVKKFLKKGARVNCKGKDDWTPLHIATEKGNGEIAALLLSKGANINIRGPEGSTPLHIAAERGHMDTAVLLVSNGADINIQDVNDWTPLHQIAGLGQTDTAALLLSNGANINKRGPEGRTPLHIAAERGNTDIAALFLLNGAAINSQDVNDWTPLHIAAERGHTDTATLLVSKGANIYNRGPADWTPLHTAAWRGHRGIAALLVSNVANVDIENAVGRTPLHIAVESGHTDIAALLVSKGADINRQDVSGKTALNIADRKLKILLQLIKMGVDVSHATETANYCDTLEEAMINLQSRPPLATSVPVPPLAASVPSDKLTELGLTVEKTKIYRKLIEKGFDSNQSTQAAKYCDNLEEAMINICSYSHASDIVPRDIRPHGAVKQPYHGNVLSGIKDPKTIKSLISDGTYESYGNRIYLAGACNVGKSTLASLLIGDKIPLKWMSTDGLRIFFGRNGIDVENRKMVPLKKGKWNRVLSNVLRGRPDINQKESEKELAMPVLTCDGGSSEHMDVSGHVDSGLKSEQLFPGRVMSSTFSKESPSVARQKKILAKPKQIRGFHRDIKAELRKGNYKVNIAPCDLVDFGGQKSYDMTHQLFIQGKGTFTLIFDGRNGLRDHLKEYNPEEITTESILKHWVDSILMYCGVDDGDVVPVILFVATHRDCIKNENEQSRRISAFKQGLREMFQNHERKNRIKYDDIFFINGTDKSDLEVQRLQTTYVDIAFQQKSWGERMPVAWVPLELQISEMAENEISIISKKDLEDLNRDNDDLALNKDQLDLFLKRQHSLGKIMYFEGRGMEEYVILKPPSLVDILRSFITDQIFFPTFGRNKTILEEMTKTGIIRKKDLFKLWSNDHCSKHMPRDDFKKFVAKVLVHLDLLVEPKCDQAQSNFFLVPCMVKQKPSADFIDNLNNDKTLFMSYTLSKSSIPSALSFKLIGAILNMLPLKKTENEICLYHKAAILHINKDNELRILGTDDRIVVCLLNSRAKTFISPDIASCVQECLSTAMTTALEFYHNTCGKIVSTSDISNLLQIEVGEKCERDFCYILLTDAKTKPSWKCSAGNEHKTEKLLYWSYDKKQERCTANCTGLDQTSLSASPSEQHLVRLAGKIMKEKCKDLVTELELPYHEWDNICQQEHDVLMINFKALCTWTMYVKRQGQMPTFQMLYDALIKAELNNHWLCEIFREYKALLEIQNENLQRTPNDDTLQELSRKIGNCALHLGVELGLETVESERTIQKYSKDIFEQNYDILTKWSKSGSNTTLRRLMQALHIVDPRGLEFLDNKYNIGLFKPQ